MDEEQDDQNEELDDGQGLNITPPKGIKGLGNKAKNAGKEGLKKVGKAINEGLKKLWAAIPPKVKIYIILGVVFIVICAAVIIALTQKAAAEANNSIDSYYEKNPTAKGAQLNKDTGSLLLATQDEIKEMAKIFYKDVDNRGSSLGKDMRKNFQDGDKENSKINIKDGAIAVRDKRPAYEHILNTEKYNFNRIVWREFNRSKMEGSEEAPKQPEMKVDTDSNLQYPADKDNTPLKTFIDVVRPYLQTWIIPFNLYTGTLTAGTSSDGSQNVAFAYEIIAKAFHNITIDKYNMKKLTNITEEDIYDETTTIYKVTVTIDKNAKITSKKETPVSTTEQCKHSEIRTIENKETDMIKYVVKQLKLFDSYIQYDYEYTEYNKNEDPDEIAISRVPYKHENGTADYPEVPKEENLTIPNPQFPLNPKEQAPKPPKKIVSYTEKHVVKEGYTEKTTKIWKDKLKQTNYEKRANKIEDVKEEINPSVLDSHEKGYYSELAQTKQLNKVDLMNARKDYYIKYISASAAYSKNIGYNRTYLIYSYDILRKEMNEMHGSHNKKSFAYGKSLGIEEIKVPEQGAILIDGGSGTQAGGRWHSDRRR